MTVVIDEDIKTKEYHLKRLTGLAKQSESELVFGVDGNIYRNGQPIAVEATYEQKAWFNRRVKGPKRSWERWFVGHYFTEKQKQDLGLIDEEIETGVKSI